VEGYGEKDNRGDYKFQRKHTHHLNWLACVYGDHPLQGTLIAFSFSRGEFTKGRGWLAGAQMRKVSGRTVPLWAQVWEMSIGTRKNAKGEWYGFDPNNPT